MRLAAIDVGTQSVKLSVATLMPDGSIRIVERRRVPSQFPSSEGGAVLGATAIAHVVECVAEACASARSLGADRVRAIGTSGVREAADASALQTAISEACGVELQVVTGEEEALLVWDAVAAGLTDGECSVMVDVGGGSTEMVLGQGRCAKRVVSMPMGAVRCADRFSMRGGMTLRARLELEDWVDGHLREAGAPTLEGVGSVIATGGTVTVLAMLAHFGMPLPHNPPAEAVRGATLSAASVRRSIDAIVSMNPDRRMAETGLSTSRSDVIVPGAVILLQTLRWIGAETCSVSEVGLRDGVLRRMAAEVL
ncbi:MAG: hypothetical protein QF561_06250 [Phycisphaerales bacterium]|nr:hypothetical protein [Phycisphaerales bacterium]